jgi:hypothetical protein
MTKHNRLATDCPNGKCGPAHKRAYDSYHTVATVSTIGFVAGGVAAGAGVVLLLVKPQSLVSNRALIKERRSARASAGHRSSV